MTDKKKEDQLLWEKYNETTTPLEHKKVVLTKALPRPKKIKISIDEEIVAPSERMEPIKQIEGMDRALVAKMRRRKARVQASLDLHGMTQREAYSAVMQFVQQSYAGGVKYLRIITGKGRGGIGQGVLRQKLTVWLQEDLLRVYVDSISEAPPHDGGAGAFYIVLRRQKK